MITARILLLLLAPFAAAADLAAGAMVPVRPLEPSPPKPRPEAWAPVESAPARPVRDGGPPLARVEARAPAPGEERDVVLSPTARSAARLTFRAAEKVAQVRVVNLETGATTSVTMPADTSADRPVIDDAGGTVRPRRPDEREFENRKGATASAGGTEVGRQPFQCLTVRRGGSTWSVPLGPARCGPDIYGRPERVKLGLADDGLTLAAAWNTLDGLRQTCLQVWRIGDAPREALRHCIRDLIPRAVFVRDGSVVLATDDGIVRKFSESDNALRMSVANGLARLVADGRAALLSDGWLWDPAAGLLRVPGLEGYVRAFGEAAGVGLIATNVGSVAVSIPSGDRAALPPVWASRVGNLEDWADLPGQDALSAGAYGTATAWSPDGRLAATVNLHEASVVDRASGTAIFGPVPVPAWTRPTWVVDLPAFLTRTGVLLPGFSTLATLATQDGPGSLDPTGSTVGRPEGGLFDIVTGAKLAARPDGLRVGLGGVTTGDGRMVAPAPTLAGEVTALALAPDGHTLYSGHGDGIVRAWDLDRMEQTAIVASLQDDVRGLAGWGRRLVAADRDGWIAVDLRDGDVRRGRSNAPGPGQYEAPIPVVQAGPDEVFVLYQREQVWSVDPATGRTRWAAALERSGPMGLDGFACAPDGRRVAVVSWDGAVHVLAADSGDELARLAPAAARELAPRAWEQRTRRNEGLTWDERGLVAFEGAQVRVWDAPSALAAGRWPAAGRSVATKHGRVVVRPGGLLALLREDGKMHLWGAHDGEVYVVTGAGGRFASAGEDGVIRIWREDGAPLGVLSAFGDGGWVGRAANGAVHSGGALPWLRQAFGEVPPAPPKLTASGTPVELVRGGPPVELRVQVSANTGVLHVALDPTGLPPGVTLWPARTADLRAGEAAEITAALIWTAPPDGSSADGVLPPGTTRLTVALRADGVPAGSVDVPIVRSALDLAVSADLVAGHVVVRVENSGVIAAGPLQLRVVARGGVLPAGVIQPLAGPAPGEVATVEVPLPEGLVGPFRVDLIAPGWPGTLWTVTTSR